MSSKAFSVAKIIRTGVNVNGGSTSTNTPNSLVVRDASGNFSAGTITATFSGNASTATSATSATTAGTVTTAAQPNITSVGTLTSLTSSGTVSGSELTSTNATGDEGGQINLAKPPNATISGGVTIDVYQDKIRFFEKDGTSRGVFIDLTGASASVGTNLLAGGVGDGTLTSAKFSSATSLIIYNSAGTVLKTIYSPGS